MLFTVEHFSSMMYPVISAAMAMAEKLAAKLTIANTFFIKTSSNCVFGVSILPVYASPPTSLSF
jgi:hypothetical protein